MNPHIPAPLRLRAGLRAYPVAGPKPGPSPTHLSADPITDSPVARWLRDPLGTVHHIAMAIADHALGYGVGVAAVVAVAAVMVLAARRLVHRWRHARLARDARLVEILPPPRTEISGAEALWANVVGLLRPTWRRRLTGQPHLAFEYAFTHGGLRIRLWVPGLVPPGLIERAVEAAWPGARTVTRPADRITPLPPAATGGHLRLARPDHHPLRSRFTDDPLRGLLGAAGLLSDGEHALAQILVRPVTGRPLRRAYRAAAALRGQATRGIKAGLFDLIIPTRPAAREPRLPARPEVAGEVRAILDKAAQPRLEVLIRYGVATDPGTAADPARAQEWRRGRAHALASAFAVFTGHNHLVRRRLRHPGRALAERRMGRGDLLSVAELAAIAHLPTDEMVPGLMRAPARPVAPPPGVPDGGPGTRILGDSDAGRARPIALRIADARHHCQVIGSNGTGKTTFLLNWALDDANAGRGLVFIEPKGESELLLSRLPAEAAGRVVLFDPDDGGAPPSLNVLEGPNPTLTADAIVGIFRRIYADFWGPRTDDVLRSACLTLIGRPGATLADVSRLLSDAAYRRRATASVTHPELRGFWDWYNRLSDAQRGQVTGPVMNKLRAVLLRGFARDILASGPSTVDLVDVLDHGGIVIARLPKGVLGEDTARLLGSLILAKTWQAILARARTPERDRADTGVYVDECHNFLTLPHGIDDMLAEARAYRAGLVLAHQNLAQLPRDMREAISANARNKIFFTVSPEDARDLERHVTPNLTAHDLAHLDAFQTGARLMSGHALTPACTARTRPLPAPIKGRATQIRQAARAAYSPKRARPTPGRSRADDDPRRDPIPANPARNAHNNTHKEKE